MSSQSSSTHSLSLSQNIDIQRFLKKYNIKSTNRQLKSDMISGSINGATFGLCYSYYFLPIQFNQSIRLTKYRGSKLLYTMSNCIRFGLLFGLVRASINAIDRQQFDTNKALALKCLTVLSAMLII